MDSVLVLYLLLLAGSLSLGLEAMMLGMGGKIIPLYRKTPLFVLGMGILTGFIIVAVSITLGILLGLESLYTCVLAFVLTIGTGRFIRVIRPQIEEEFRLTVKPLKDEEIKRILKKRGLKPRKR